MNQNPVKKTRIQLEDYDYQKDIEYRLRIAELSVFEVDLINEILHGSLKISISQLQSDLNVNREMIDVTLKKLADLELFKIEGDEIHVSKEMRKYYDTQIEKFDDDFRPDMEFLRALLGKVPIHVLPTWYLIPRTSDDIFQSIIEKFLLTPNLFQRYLDELTFDTPILNKIVEEVYSAPKQKVYSRDLLEKYSLERKELEEYLLILEFNLVCCLSYNQVDGRWEEVISPFYEWKEYQRFIEQTAPQPITNPDSIRRTHPHDFGFVQDITRLLLGIQDEKTTLEDSILPRETVRKYLPEHDPVALSSDYLIKLIQITIDLNYAEKDGDTLVPLDSANDWIKKPVTEQAMTLYRYTSGQLPDRDARAILKSLKRVDEKGWVYLDDFLKGFTGSVSGTQPVTLKRKGRRWKYEIPEFTADELAKIEETIFVRLFESGIVATGRHEGKLCFCVTPFGKSVLS